MNRKKVIKLFGGFLAVMLIFTILSRAVSGASMARVDTVKITTGTIEHKVKASGRVEAGQEAAVYTESGQRVKEICVREGQTVEAGEVLFRLDMEELEEQILAAQQELEKTKLQNQDVANAKAFEQSNRQTARQRAQEDYNQAVSQGDSAVAEAKRVWDEAEQALQDYINSSAAADNGGAAAGDLGEDEQPKGQGPRKEEGTDTEKEQGQEEPATDGSSQQGQDSSADKDSPVQGTDNPQDGGTSKQGEDNPAEGGSPNPGNQGTQGNGTADREAEKEALEQAAAEAKAAYDAAVSSRTDSVRSAVRALEDAAKPQSAEDSTQKQNEITRQQQDLALNKLLALQTAQGEVKASVSGVIKQILVSTGDFTSDGAAMRMEDTSKGGRIVLSVDKSNEKYVGKGSPVKLKAFGSKDVITDYAISNITANKQDSAMLDLTIDLPQGALEPGIMVDADIVPKSESYSSVVPLQALHEEQNGYYVLVLQEEQGVLGTQLVARRLNVEVLDKNDKDAALDEGLLTRDQEIISSSSRMIQDGSRVRRIER